MVHYTQPVPLDQLFLDLAKRRVRPLYIETCCLPRIDSHETQKTPVWPTHDVTGMCVSEFKTHPPSSWHPFTIIIAQPQPSFCDPCRRSCLAVAVFSWTRGPGPGLQLCFLQVCGPCREARLPAGCSHSLALHLHRAPVRLWVLLRSQFRVGKGNVALSLEIACDSIWLLGSELDGNFQIQMAVKPHTCSYIFI